MFAKLRSGAILLSLIFFLVPVAVILPAFRNWFPPLASKHGSGVDIVILYTLVLVGFFVTAGHFVLAYIIVRFTGKEKVTVRTFSAKTEMRWALGLSILMAILAEGGALFLAMPTWGKLYETTVPPDATIVEVTAQQFQWFFRYPGPDGVFGRTKPELISDSNPLGIDPSDPASKDDVVVPDEMDLPVDRPVYLYLHSKDIVHSLDLPNFRIRQDIVPGMRISISFVPTKTGTYEIACSQVCGLGHYTMRGILSVLPTPEAFEKWLKEQKGE